MYFYILISGDLIGNGSFSPDLREPPANLHSVNNQCVVCLTRNGTLSEVSLLTNMQAVTAVQRVHHECSNIKPKPIQRTDVSPLCKSELKALNYLILKHLTSSIKRSPLIADKTEISDQLYEYLINTYSFNNKFANGSKLLNDHSFFIERFFNETDYCTISTNQHGESTFKIRLTKPQRFNFFINSILEKKELFYKNLLHFEFCVDDKKFFE